MQHLPTDYSSSDEPAYKEDSTLYNNEYYPSKAATIVGDEFQHGDQHYVIVSITPFKYKPSEQQLYMYRWMRISLKYDENESSARDLMPIKMHDQTAEQLLDRDFVHVSDSIMGEKDSIGSANAEVAYAQMRTTDYVIIADSENLKEPLKRIVALKNQKGYNVQVVTVDQISKMQVARDGDVIEKSDGSRSVINDAAGKIRGFLRDAYSYGSTKYVLLAGDSVPYRKTRDNVPTDWYYCDLNTDWNTQKYDFGPELYVGRIFAANPQQVKNYSDNLLKYELNPGGGDASYLQKGLYVQVAQMEGKKEAEMVGAVMNQVVPDTTLINGDESKDFPRGADLIQELNKDYGFVSLHLHGEPTNYVLGENAKTKNYFWRLWAKDDERIKNSGYPNKYEYGNHLGLLTYRNKPNVIYSIACTTNPYDKPHPYEAMTMNIGKAFTSGYRNGGAVAYLGNTRVGYVGSSARMETNFAKLIASGVTTVGEAEAWSRHDYYGAYHLKFTHNLIGDPEFKLWTAAPKKLENVTVQRNNNSITVSGLPSQDSCYVAYSDGRDNTWHKVLGSCTFSHANPNARIMVYGSNLLPFIAPMKVQNENIKNSQYILATSAEFGKSIDSGRTSGEVVIKSGVKYQIEASGKTSLHSGFTVEKGAKFSVKKGVF